MTVIRPVPGDPDADFILNLIDVGADWYLTTHGDYEAMAVEAMANNGTNYQPLVAFTLPVQRNHTTEPETLHIMISPDDAYGLANMLQHAATVIHHLTNNDDPPHPPT